MPRFKRPEPKFKRGDRVIYDPSRRPGEPGKVYRVGGSRWDKEYKEWQYNLPPIMAPESEYLLLPAPATTA